MIEKNRNNFKMIGLLSKMSLTHKHPAGFTIGIFRGGTNKITDTALQAIGDLERGIEIGPNVVLRWWSQNDKSVMNLFSDPTEQLKNQLNLYVLEATLEKDREINPSEEYEIFRYLCDCIETVIFAFHLTKPGHIEANIKLGTGPDPGVFLSANHDYKINSTGFLFLGQNNTAYLLELNEIFAVNEIDFHTV
ncbi:MAG: hypothetical protein M1490_06445, partial [Candidatus Bathyarchaeota archaeon]|nr:hypothetical protein [Candidatus Bathyarchaeota archaeon]